MYVTFPAAALEQLQLLQPKPTKVLRLPNFRQASLPFLAFLACIDHVVGLADLDKRRFNAEPPRCPPTGRADRGWDE